MFPLPYIVRGLTATLDVSLRVRSTNTNLIVTSILPFHALYSTQAAGSASSWFHTTWVAQQHSCHNNISVDPHKALLQCEQCATCRGCCTTAGGLHHLSCVSTRNLARPVPISSGTGTHNESKPADSFLKTSPPNLEAGAGDTNVQVQQQKRKTHSGFLQHREAGAGERNQCSTHSCSMLTRHLACLPKP